MTPYIFLAEVISSNQDGYQLKVLEVFKGFGVPVYIYGRHDEEGFVPFTDDICWIIYSMDAQLKTSVSVCSFSRSFTYPALPVKDMTLMIDYLTPVSKIEENYRNKIIEGQNWFIEEINWLREKRPLWVSTRPLDDITGRYPDYGLSELKFQKSQTSVAEGTTD